MIALLCGDWQFPWSGSTPTFKGFLYDLHHIPFHQVSCRSIHTFLLNPAIKQMDANENITLMEVTLQVFPFKIYNILPVCLGHVTLSLICTRRSLDAFYIVQKLKVSRLYLCKADHSFPYHAFWEEKILAWMMMREILDDRLSGQPSTVKNQRWRTLFCADLRLFKFTLFV